MQLKKYYCFTFYILHFRQMMTSWPTITTARKKINNLLYYTSIIYFRMPQAFWSEYHYKCWLISKTLHSSVCKAGPLVHKLCFVNKFCWHQQHSNGRVGLKNTCSVLLSFQENKLLLSCLLMNNCISFLNITEYFSPEHHLTTYLANSYSKIHQSNHGNLLHFCRAWRNIHQYLWNSFCLTEKKMKH